MTKKQPDILVKNEIHIPNVRLREAREQRGWSQARVAEHLQTEARTVSRWERGINAPSPYFRERLCLLFGQTASDLGLLPQISLSQGSQEQNHPIVDPLIPLSLGEALLGRTDLLEQLKTTLAASSTGTVFALHGLPGVGKTALVVTLAHDSLIRDLFPDGILWMNLGPEPYLLTELTRWNTLLHLPIPDSRETPSWTAWARQIQQALAPRRMLLLLDDAWSSEIASAALLGGPFCTSVLTTRFPTVARQLAPFTTFAVPELAPQESLVLLSTLAPDLHTSSKETDILCATTGGLPLAITLLGKHLHMLDLQHYPHRLDMMLRALQEPASRVTVTGAFPWIQRPSLSSAETVSSVATVISRSLKHLPLQAQEALSCLALLPPKPTRFSHTAALAISGHSLQTLDMLIDAGLLESPEPGFYFLHQTIVDTVRTTYPASKEIQQRLVAYLVTISGEQATVLQREWTTLEQGLHEAYSVPLPVALAQALHQLMPFLLDRGWYTLAQDFLLRAEYLLRKHPDQKHYLVLILFHLGECEEKLGHLEQAIVFLRTCLLLAEQAYPQQRSKILLLFSKVWHQQGDYHKAIEMLQQGLLLARHYKQHEQMIRLLTNLGVLADEQGLIKEAETYLEEAQGYLRQQYSPQLACGVLVAAGGNAVAQGAYQRAEVLFREGAKAAQTQQNQEYHCLFLTNQGVCAMEQGHMKQAHSIFEAALAIAEQIQHPRRINVLHINLGELALQQHTFATAETLLFTCLQMARDHHFCNHEVVVLKDLGCLAREQQQWVAAEHFFHEGLALAEHIDNGFCYGEILLELAEMYVMQEREEQAASLLTQILTQKQVSSPLLDARIKYILARLSARKHQQEEAEHLAEISLQKLENMHHRDAVIVRHWLEALRAPVPPHNTPSAVHHVDELPSRCPRCGHHTVHHHGLTAAGTRRYRCRQCHRTWTLSSLKVSSPAHRIQAHHLHSDGWSYRAIARKLGIHHTTVARWLKQDYS